jgi:hypothetical protein
MLSEEFLDVNENIEVFRLIEECVYFMGYNAVEPVESRPTFRRTVLPQFLVFSIEDWGDIFLRNFG